jgi:hypothetical protein
MTTPSLTAPPLIALIAGRGALPDHVAAALAGRVLIAALDGQPPDRLIPDLTFRLEELGTLLATLQARGVTGICMAGAVSRPGVDPARIDAATRPLLPHLMQALRSGDDGALRTVMAVFEAAGFTVHAAHDLCPDLALPAGIPTRAQPSVGHATDARLGTLTLARMGAADQGQACVIRGATVIAREDARGTDAMLDDVIAGRVAGDDEDPFSWSTDQIGDLLDTAADWLSGPDVPVRAGGILCKAPKPTQDLRADLPAIGLITAQKAVAARLDGIVIDAGRVFVFDRAAVIATLDAAGLFLWVR